MKPTDIFALHEAVFDGTTNTLASLLLVTVVPGTVKETVTNFNSVVNHLRADISGGSRPIVSVRLTSAQVALGICKGDQNEVDRLISLGSHGPSINQAFIYADQ